MWVSSHSHAWPRRQMRRFGMKLRWNEASVLDFRRHRSIENGSNLHFTNEMWAAICIEMKCIKRYISQLFSADTPISIRQSAYFSCRLFGIVALYIWSDACSNRLCAMSLFTPMKKTAAQVSTIAIKPISSIRNALRGALFLSLEASCWNAFGRASKHISASSIYFRRQIFR